MITDHDLPPLEPDHRISRERQRQAREARIIIVTTLASLAAIVLFLSLAGSQ